MRTVAGRWRGRALAAAGSALVCLAIPVSSAYAAWSPEPASYGVGQTHTTFPSFDGTELYARVFFPTDSRTGAAAPGPFPVLVTQTPYGTLADQGAGFLGGNVSALTGENPYLVKRGYIEVSFDTRGTGSSGGTFGLLDPIQGQDGAAAIRWAAGAPNSNGVVGLVGASYLGITQFAAAANAGPNSPVKAMFPIIASSDLYRDEVTAGGVPSLEFNLPYLAAVLPGIADSNAAVGAAISPAYLGVLAGHLAGVLATTVPTLTNIITGGSEAFDGPFWQARSPVTYLPQVVAQHIPVFLVGGWYDLFQRGEPLNYSGLQNLYTRRPVFAPMSVRQQPTSRYQLLDGDVYHLTAGNVTYHGLDISQIELAWFDRWLKGIQTGIDRTSTPLHVVDLGTGTTREASRYPFDQAKPTTYYFQSGGQLSTSRPTTAKGSDTIVFSGASIPCSTSIDQWGAGVGATLFQAFRANNYCSQDASFSQVGPGTVNFTTAPFQRPTTLAGPIGATVFATANTKETLWVVSISDVSANGNARQLTQGVLAGSMRALDAARTWAGADGRPLRPYHPYTQAALQPVVPGQLTRYDIEVFPTFDTLLPGHRLRVTVATDDFPHVFPDEQQFPNLLGGVYNIQRTATAASSVELPLADPNSFGPPASCASATGRLARTALGPIKLLQTRARTRQAFTKYSTHGRRNWDYLCLAGAGIRVGYPSATLLQTLSAAERRRVVGRVVLALTANHHYALDGVQPGTRFQRVRRRLHPRGPFSLGANTWYFVPRATATGVLKIRHGVVQEIGIADTRLTAGTRAQSVFVRSFD